MAMETGYFSRSHLCKNFKNPFFKGPIINSFRWGFHQTKNMYFPAKSHIYILVRIGPSPTAVTDSRLQPVRIHQSPMEDKN